MVIADREDRQDREGRRRPRRRPGRQPAAVRGTGRGLGAHGPRLRAHRGLPVRRDWACPTNMTLRSLGIIRPKDMPIDRGRCSSKCPSPTQPYGVKGVGEIGLVPTSRRLRWPPHCTWSTGCGATRCRWAVPGGAATRSRRPSSVVGATTPGLVCRAPSPVLRAGRDGHARRRRCTRRRLLRRPCLDGRSGGGSTAPLRSRDPLPQWSCSSLRRSVQPVALAAGTTCIIDHHESPECHRGQPRRRSRPTCAEVGVRGQLCIWRHADRLHQDSGRMHRREGEHRRASPC